MLRKFTFVYRDKAKNTKQEIRVEYAIATFDISYSAEW